MLVEKLKHKNLILASGSPRRQKFLRDLGLEFEIRLKEVDEKYPSYLKEFEITDYLSKLKAAPFLTELKDDDILITADTIVWFKGEAIGKPTNIQGALKMLNILSDNTHEVISSFCISTKSKQIVVHDSTKVHFTKLNSDEIGYYVNNFKPLDKAGSYGIQEWIGYIGIDKIEGSYFNVMGFPIHKFYQEMIKL